MADGKVKITVDSNAKSATAEFKALDTSVRKTGDAAKRSEKSFLNLGTALKGAFTVVALKQVFDMSNALVNLASQAEETQNKFNTAFRGIETTAEQVAAKLAEAYNLSSQESKKLLSDTGDLLKGFGFTATEALTLSTQVQQLAADLTSYNNIQGGAAEASRVLTKALLGETDALVGLGVKLSQTDLKGFAEAQGLVFEELSRSEKALLTYQAVLKQSADAVGDVERSQGSYAASTRILGNAIVNLNTSLGGELLPSFNKMKIALAEFVNIGAPAFIAVFGTIIDVVVLLGETIDAVVTSIFGLGEVVASLGFGIVRALKGDLTGAFDIIRKTSKGVASEVGNDLKDIKNSFVEIFDLSSKSARVKPVDTKTNKPVSPTAPAVSNSAGVATSEAAGIVAQNDADVVVDVWDEASKQIRDSLQGNLKDSLLDALTSGENAFKNFGQTALQVINQIANEFARNALSGAISQGAPSGGGFLSNLVGAGLSLAGGSFFGGQGTGARIAQTGNAGFVGPLQAFAKGGVVNSPTLFPMQGGTGLAGEAGAEAIMPLKRGSNGDLGVGAVSPNINIYNQSGAQIETVERPNNEVDVFVRRVNGALASDRSRAAFDTALSRTQNVGVQAV